MFEPRHEKSSPGFFDPVMPATCSATDTTKNHGNLDVTFLAIILFSESHKLICALIVN